MKRVNVTCTVDVSGSTVEDAICAAIRLIRGVYAKVEDPDTVDKYHYWDRENDGDVDWIAHSDTTVYGRDTTVYGTATGHAMLKIANK